VALKHIGLFEGIGGFSLAARWAGWETVAWCEWNEFGQKVLRHHFPNAQGHGDITQTDFTIYRGRVDIITGGFPCQPYSTAGKRLGKEDERHLWPEMLRAIREVQPRWVVGENVLGLVNWSGGLVFEEVQADLEAEGYEVQPYVLPACGVQNAPHRRDRVWFVAYAKHNGHITAKGGRSDGEDGQRSKEGEEITKQFEGVRQSEKLGSIYATDTDSTRISGQSINARTSQEVRQGWSNTSETWDNGFTSRWDKFPTQPALCGGDDGIPTELDGITLFKWRNESIKAYGNAIVPQVALQIFKAINQYESR
jgi:DNA (cytosine-5)-methyltransferase 1